MSVDNNNMHDEKSLGLPTKQQKRSLDEMRTALQLWLRERMPDREALQVVDIELPKGSGLANETVLLTAQWQSAGQCGQESYVARIETPDPLFPGTTAEKQYRMYAALADEPEIPVPPVLGFEADTRWLGAPFFLMKKIEGRVPADDPPFHHSGWVVDLPEAERASMWRDAVRVMANLHKVDAGKLQFLNPLGVKDGLRATLDYYITAFDEPVNESHAIIDYARAWLLKNYPGNYGLALAWGDARVGNMIFRDGRCQAVLDWDMVSLAGAETDLAWWSMFEQSNTTSMGIQRLPGFGTPRAMLNLWEQHAGRNVRDFDWHLVHACYQVAVIVRRLAKMLKKAGLLPPASAFMEHNNTGVQYLTTLLRRDPIAELTTPWPGLDV